MSHDVICTSYLKNRSIYCVRKSKWLCPSLTTNEGAPAKTEGGRGTHTQFFRRYAPDILSYFVPPLWTSSPPYSSMVPTVSYSDKTHVLYLWLRWVKPDWLPIPYKHIPYLEKCTGIFHSGIHSVQHILANALWNYSRVDRQVECLQSLTLKADHHFVWANDTIYTGSIWACCLLANQIFKSCCLPPESAH
jgi:hypothetical protein